MSLELYQVPALDDNYIYFLHSDEKNLTAVIDPGEVAPVMEFLGDKGLKLDHIFITHHHWDHVNGVKELKQTFQCPVTAPKYETERIENVDHWVGEGDRIDFASSQLEVMALPGHTRGLIAYYIADEKLLFSSDILFSMGCGRNFEGAPKELFDSLQRIKALPDDTLICSTHEYTQSNGDFAITVEPENKNLQKRRDEVTELREDDEFTVPMPLSWEKLTNPFLRTDSEEIQKNLSMENTDEVEVFTRLRKMKDQF